MRLGAGRGFGLVLRGLGRDCRDVLGGWNRSLIRDRGSETPWERRIKNLGLGFGDLERERRECCRGTTMFVWKDLGLEEKMFVWRRL